MLGRLIHHGCLMHGNEHRNCAILAQTILKFECNSELRFPFTIAMQMSSSKVQNGFDA